jgi:hypothetical protein
VNITSSVDDPARGNNKLNQSLRNINIKLYIYEVYSRYEEEHGGEQNGEKTDGQGHSACDHRAIGRYSGTGYKGVYTLPGYCK